MRQASMAAVLALGLSGTPTVGGATACASLLPPMSTAAQPPHWATAQDLLGLRDIGPASPGSVSGPIFSLSHDGRKLAFQIRKADVDANAVCLGVGILDLQTGAVHLIDQGGVPDLGAPRSGSFAAFTPSGLILDNVPQFSPDDESIAYLRRDDGITRLWWRSESGPATRAETAFDVEGFAWLPDGTGLVFSGRPDLIRAKRAIVDEGREGYLFDVRWMPANANKPLVSEPIEKAYFVVDVRSRVIRRAAKAEQELLDADAGKLPKVAMLGNAGANGALAWTSAADPADVNSTTVLHASFGLGAAASVCTDAACQHVTGLWWAKDGRILYFMNREGWANSQLAFYRWKPSDGKPSRIFVTDDVFLGCQMASGRLFCGYESATSPRRIVSIDLETAAITTLFEPNPEYSAVRPGKVQRLHWTNTYGIKGFGDLVLPPDHEEGEMHPLVVVQYQSRGFLRGGTGDAFPIQVLAAHGIAVLSVEKPADIGALRGGKTWEEIGRLDRIDWADRKSIEASIEAGIAQAKDLGGIDMTRLGISGLSDGASGTQFALVNSRLFTAAAIETCCEEPSVIEFLDGPEVEERLHGVGYPTLKSPDDHFWNGMSFRQDAEKVDAPLLMQLSDREYLGALEGYMALKAADRPAEMYVFPDEYHILWQPAHRLAAYNRAVDWFDFWLRGYEDPAPAKARQYERWRALEVLRDKIMDGSSAN